MSATVAVITSALSDRFFFPLWHKYYGALFGPRNLYVVTHKDLGGQFQDWRLGGLWELPQIFDDRRCAAVISTLVRSLLESHDVVVRVDVDEFLIPDPRHHRDLTAFIATLQAPYATARGFDVIQLPQEPAIDWTRPILVEQRSFAYANASLNKTCITRIPLTWSAGFHGATAYPLLGDLFMMHLKWADAPRLLDWFGHMTSQVGANESLIAYYRPEATRLERHQQNLAAKHIESGWAAFRRREFYANFLSQLHFDTGRGTWELKHEIDPVLLRLPDELRGVV